MNRSRPAFFEPIEVQRMPRISLHKRTRIVKKVLHWKQLDAAQKRSRTKKGANQYAFDFMRLNAGKFVSINNLQEYCGQRRKQLTGKVFSDSQRAFEILRKDKLPLEWDEIVVGNEKFVKYAPHKKDECIQEIINNHKHKADSFAKDVIAAKMEHYGSKCAITGIPNSDGGLAADHFVPKEKGGKSEAGNCVILNKILNEKKNNMMPVEWFAKTLMTNFVNVCVESGLNKEEVTQDLIAFLQDME